MFDLSGRAAIVTGAGRGLGRQMAATLAELGCAVVVNNVSPERNAEVVEALRAAGHRAVGVPGDVTADGVPEALVEACLAEFGKLDILVNNAGITRDGLAARMSDEHWNEVLAVNLTGPFRVVRAALRPMLRQRSGRIINVSSVVGRMGNAGQANYAASKAGLIGLTKSLAREVGSRGVTVNAVAPGFIDEGMTEGLPEEVRAKLAEQIPLGRLGTALDVSGVVAFLAGDAAAYLTGQTISVDGGMVMF